MRTIAALVALGMMTSFASAQEVPVEVRTLGDQKITLYMHSFLTADERTTLQLVATNENALRLFVERPGRHAALAVAPGDGFIRNGRPVESAVALSDLRNASLARKAVLDACGDARKSAPGCVVVLEVAPLR